MTFITSIRPKVSTSNSTNIVLDSDEVYTGTSEDVTIYKSVTVSILTDQNSAFNGLQVQFSTDNENWNFTKPYNITANIQFEQTLDVSAKYFRLLYTNGSVAQTVFRLSTILNTSKNPTVTDVNINNYNSNYNELRTSERTPILTLKSVYGFSVLRDIKTETNGGVLNDSFVTNTGEYQLTTDGTTGGLCQLFSAERNVYQAGYSSIGGLGVRLSSPATNTTEYFWGIGENPYEANSNGLYFGNDSTGTFVAIRRDGTTTKTYQSNWNSDSLDGNGPSRRELTLSKGNIYHVEYNWYGYGIIEYVVYLDDIRNQKSSTRIVVHRIIPNEQTSITNPNLPIIASVKSDEATSSLFVGGRQFSVDGRYRPNKRITGQLISGATVGNTTPLTPLVSFRRKSAYISGSIKLSSFDIISDINLVVYVILNGTLNSPTYVTPGVSGSFSATETALETDISSTQITGGQIIWTSLVQGGASKNSNNFTSEDVIDIDIPSLQPVTLCALSLGGSATVTSVFRMTEQW